MKEEKCDKCFYGFTKETCPNRKLENERLILSLLLIVSLTATIISFL